MNYHSMLFKRLDRIENKIDDVIREMAEWGNGKEAEKERRSDDPPSGG